MKASNYAELLNKVLSEPETASVSVNDITDMLAADEAESIELSEKIEELTKNISELQATNAQLIASNSALRNEIAIQTDPEPEPELTEIEKLLKDYEDENNKED